MFFMMKLVRRDTVTRDVVELLLQMAVSLGLLVADGQQSQ